MYFKVKNSTHLNLSEIAGNSAKTIDFESHKLQEKGSKDQKTLMSFCN